MKLAEEAEYLLKPHWEKIVSEWNGKLPEFVSEKFLKKYLPWLQLPAEDEEEVITRARKVIAACEEDSFYHINCSTTFTICTTNYIFYRIFR